MKKKSNNADINRYLYAERYINDGSPSGFTFKNSTNSCFSPRSGLPSFHLLEFNDCYHQNFVIGQMNSLFVNKNYIHPDFCCYFENKLGLYLDISEFAVCPTASGRTLFILDDEQGNYGYLKLSYPRILDRSYRSLDIYDCVNALRFSQVLCQYIDSNILPDSFSVLKETSAKISIINNAIEGKETWGTIFREFNPYPYIDNYCIIPAFSLFSRDYLKLGMPSLISQFIRKSGLNPQEYLINVLNIIIDCYFGLIINGGIYSEMHAQNVLFQYDDNYVIKRLVLRDMSDIASDRRYDDYFVTDEIIKALSDLGQLRYLDYLLDKDDQRLHSFYFDFKLGEYLLKPIINSVCKDFLLSKDYFYNYIKQKVNEEYLPYLSDDYFPSKWYGVKKREYKDINKIFYQKRNPKFR